MRSPKNRSRGNKNRSRPTGGNIINRVFDSNGPDGRVRGTPQQIIDKYLQLHRDAMLAGDRVDAENFAQHAEHFLRVLADAQREMDAKRQEQEEQNKQRQLERDRERAEREARHQSEAAERSTSEQPRDDAAAPARKPIDKDPDPVGKAPQEDAKISDDTPTPAENTTNIPEAGDDKAVRESAEPKPKPEPKPRARRRPRAKKTAADKAETSAPSAESQPAAQ